MSVLIKNMEMPANCFRCPFCDYVSGRCDAVKENPYTPESRYEQRADFCPLVPVPPHGDLIDREWLLDIALQLMNTAKNDDIFNGVIWLWQYILEAPTIIEAEGEDNG